MCPHHNKAKDPFISNGNVWHNWKEYHFPSGLLSIPPHHPLRKGVQLCLCDCPHVETSHHWTKVMQPLLQFHHWFPQAGVCGEEHDVAHSGLKWKRKISSVVLANGQQHPNTWGRQQLCLGTFPKLLDGLLMESSQMRTWAANICSTLAYSYSVKMEQQMVKVSLTVLWCLKND